MRRVTLVVVLLLSGVSTAGADPVTLTVRGSLGLVPPGFGEADLGFPVQTGDPFVISADLHQASADLNPNPNFGNFELGRGHMTFTYFPFGNEELAIEFTAAFTGIAGVGTGSQFGDDVFFLLDTERPSPLSFQLEFSAPAETWLKSDDWAASHLARLPPDLQKTLIIQTRDATSLGSINTIEVTPIPTPTPEPASVLLLGGGVFAMSVQRWRQRRSM